MRAGVPQGSVLGPTLWNILYDEVLTINLPARINLVAYADDLAIVAHNRSVLELETAIRVTTDRITAWMNDKGLSLALQKTEVVMLKKRRYADDEKMRNRSEWTHSPSHPRDPLLRCEDGRES